MAKRRKMSRKGSRRLFTATAKGSKTKIINLAPPLRGGIRL